MQFPDVLDDLCMRFLFNLPAAEWESFERLFFAIEAAHWFYDDFYREKYPSLPRLQLKQFAAKIFGHTNLLQSYSNEVDKLTAQFQSYKQVVMTCGAALLNPSLDKVLLVRGWGSTARWGFPKGKLSNNESELAAAIREVKEETGFDMSQHLTEDQFYLDSFISRRHCRIFLVMGVPEDTIFETQTRKEISDIQWVHISDLPDSMKTVKQQSKQANGKGGKNSPNGEPSFLFAQHGVVPFTKRLRSWIKRHQKQRQHREPHVVLDMQAAITAEELEATLLPSADLMEESIYHQENGKLSPVEEPLSRPVAKRHGTPTSAKRKSSRAKARPSNATAAGSGRKNRKGERNEATRNQLTFGSKGGTSMNSSERDNLFRQYVVESDRIAAEKGLRDDFWPVPYVTSKDFTEEELQAAKDAQNVNLAKQADTHEIDLELGAARGDVAEPERVERMVEKLRSLPRPKDKEFAFDRRAVLDCMSLGNT